MNSRARRPVMKLKTVLLALAWLLAAAPAAAAPQPASDAVADEAATPATQALLIGRFRIRDMRAAEGVKMRLSFALYAEVDEDAADQMAKLIAARQHRLRNHVITAVRTAEQSDFQQPGLERLRRRIHVRLRRTEPNVQMRGLLVGEFEYFTD